MAAAYPRCRFIGYDISQYALARAEEKRRDANATNVSFHDPRDEPIPDDGSVGLLTTFDCIHDMTHPNAIIEALRRGIASDGTWSRTATRSAMPRL